MPAINQRIEVWRGDTKTIGVPIKNPDGTDYDMTGAQVHWWVGERPKTNGVQPTVFIRKALGNGIASVPGGVQIVIGKEDTDLMPIGTHYHEMKVVKGGGVKTSMTGPFELHGSLVDIVTTPAISPLIVSAPALGAPTLTIN